MKYAILIFITIVSLICVSITVAKTDTISHTSLSPELVTSTTQLQLVTPTTTNFTPQIEQHILVSNEALKALGGVGGFVIGGTGGIITGVLIGGLICPSVANSSSNNGPTQTLTAMACFGIAGAIGGSIGGMVFGTPAGVTLMGNGLHEDGHYWDAVLGGLVGPAIVAGYCEGIAIGRCNDGVMWGVGLSLNLIGSMVGYDLSRSYGRDKNVAISLAPSLYVTENPRGKIISMNLLKVTF